MKSVASLRKRFFFIFLSIVLIVGFCLVGGETVIRLHLFFSGKKGFIWVDDEYIGRVHVPGSRFVYHEDFSGEFRISRRTNSLGLIGEEIPIQKPINDFRILFLGDSFTEALQVPEGKNFCEQLQGLLNDRSAKSKKSFTVLNGGVSGFSPISAYLYLKRELLDLSPDVIILQLFANDVFEDHKVSAMSILNREEFPVKIRHYFTTNYSDHYVDNSQNSETSPWTYKLRKTLIPKSRFYKYMYSLMGKGRRRSAIHKKMTSQPLYNDANQFFMIQSENEFFQNVNFRNKAWERTQKYIRAIANLAQEHHARFLIVLIPPEAQVDYQKQSVNTTTYFTSRPSQYFNEILERFCKQQGFLFLDFLEPFKKNKSRGLYFNRDGHLTEEGHHVVAEVLLRKLRESRLLE